jgi:hypothetical protein
MAYVEYEACLLKTSLAAAGNRKPLVACLFTGLKIYE